MLFSPALFQFLVVDFSLTGAELNSPPLPTLFSDVTKNVDSENAGKEGRKCGTEPAKKISIVGNLK